MKKIIVCLFIMFLLAAVGFAAEKTLIEELNLSREQVKQIQLRQRDNSGQMLKIKKQIRTQEILLKKELAKAEPDQKKIKELSQELNQLQTKQLESKIEGFLQMKKGMTKEQLKKMEYLQNKSGFQQMYQNKGGEGSGAGSQSGRGKGTNSVN